MQVCKMPNILMVADSAHIFDKCKSCVPRIRPEIRLLRKQAAKAVLPRLLRFGKVSQVNVNQKHAKKEPGFVNMCICFGIGHVHPRIAQKRIVIHGCGSLTATAMFPVA